MNNIFDQYFTFTTFIEKLKKLERFKGQYYWRDYPEQSRYESVADHTWRMAILVLLFEDRLSQPFQTEKALKMALIHDLPEIIAGDASPLGEDGTGKDTYAFRSDLKEAKFLAEKAAAEELFGKLPDPQQSELLDLWHEYERQDCFEAKVVKAFDKLECMLQIIEYQQGHMFPKHLDFVIDYPITHVKIDPAIEQFYQLLADKLRLAYNEYKPERTEI
jgi:putative hydrolase of HD superfamily